MSAKALPLVAAEEARRLLLGGAGLMQDPQRPATAASVYRTVERLGFVQVDTINVLERAHHHILMSRLDGYRPDLLRRLLERERRLFEHWTHDASIIPTIWLNWWRPRFEAMGRRIERNRWWRSRIGPRPRAIIDHVLKRIADEGPLGSRDFEHDRRGRRSAWWGWKPQKAALEYLWATGRLVVRHRGAGFDKAYDLMERVFPDLEREPIPERGAFIEWACSTALDRLGTATAGEVAAFWRAVEPAEARAWCAEAVRTGRACEVLVESADGSPPRRALALPDWRARLRRLGEAPARARLLSPFDPVLRDRKRALRLFNFDYRFEAFVPAPARRYGYYVLPILEADRLVGRLDGKFQRAAGALEVKRVWWEDGARQTRARAKGLEEAVACLARQIGAERWALPRPLTTATPFFGTGSRASNGTTKRSRL